MSTVDRRFFENLMEAKNLSLRRLATKLGMGHSQLSLTFSGARKMQLDEAASIAEILGVPITKVIEACGISTPHGKRVSVMGAMLGDGTVAPLEPGVVERTTAPDGLPDDVIALQCRTAGSPLQWMDAWVFFCRKPAGVDPAILGRLAFAKLAGGPAVIAYSKRGYREGTYHLSGPFRAESAELEWAAPILITRN